jgi:hypothetical protein
MYSVNNNTGKAVVTHFFQLSNLCETDHKSNYFFPMIINNL